MSSDRITNQDLDRMLDHCLMAPLLMGGRLGLILPATLCRLAMPCVPVVNVGSTRTGADTITHLPATII